MAQKIANSCFLTELQKEQGDVEYNMRELSGGKKIRNDVRNSFQQYEERILHIVSDYQKYADEGSLLEYLQKLVCFLHL